MRHKQLKEKIKDVSGDNIAYSQLDLTQAIKIMRKARKLFGNMSMIEYHRLIERFPSLGKGTGFNEDDCPF